MTIETLYKQMDGIMKNILEKLVQSCRDTVEASISEVNTLNRLNQVNTTGIKPFQHNYELYDNNILYTEQALDWDGKYVEVHKPFNLEKREEVFHSLLFIGASCRRMVEPLNIPGCYLQEAARSEVNIPNWLNQINTSRIKPFKHNYEVYDDNILYTGQELDWDGKYVEVVEPFNLEKRKKAVQRVSSIVIVTTEFLWIITDICGQLSPIQLQQQHGSLFIWSSLLEILSFVVFVCAILAMIVVGARFSHLQRIMLMFWAIWMQVKSAKSLTAVSPPILGILFTGWHVLMEKQPPHEE